VDDRRGEFTAIPERDGGLYAQSVGDERAKENDKTDKKAC
jgi:hypothetical protein